MTVLSPLQTRFVAEYLVDLNATQAAIRAGYSARTANQQGPRLLVNVGIAAAIAERRQAVLKRLELTQEDIIDELRKIGFSDLRKAVRWRGNLEQIEDEETVNDDEDVITKRTVTIVSNRVQLVPSDELDDDTAAAIQSISQNAQGGVTIKLHDKRAALVDLGKHLGMFAEKVDLNVKNGGFVVNVIIEGAPEPKTIDVSPHPIR